MARGSMICCADFVATLARVIDIAHQICALLGSRLNGLLSLYSLNYTGSNKSVKGSADWLVSVLGYVVGRAPLPLC